MQELFTNPTIISGDGSITQKISFGLLVAIGLAALLWLLFHSHVAWADVQLPGEDASSKMESAGTLLRFVDTGIFKWGARILAGLCIFGAGWNLKEMRFGPAFISMIAAVLFGTAPTWVRNIFNIGGADSVFAHIEPLKPMVPHSEPVAFEESSNV